MTEKKLSRESINNFYDLLFLNNLRIAYCANEQLGLDGPFVEISKDDFLKILNGEEVSWIN